MSTGLPIKAWSCAVAGPDLGITSRCHLPFCWAHEKTSLKLFGRFRRAIASGQGPLFDHSSAMAAVKATTVVLARVADEERDAR